MCTVLIQPTGKCKLPPFPSRQMPIMKKKRKKKTGHDRGKPAVPRALVSSRAMRCARRQTKMPSIIGGPHYRWLRQRLTDEQGCFARLVCRFGWTRANKRHEKPDGAERKGDCHVGQMSWAQFDVWSACPRIRARNEQERAHVLLSSARPREHRQQMRRVLANGRPAHPPNQLVPRA